MADAWGIEEYYDDVEGRRHRVSPDTVAALREVIGTPPQDGDGRDDPQTLVRRRGDRVGPAELVLEDGAELRIGDVLPPDLPFGYHILRRGGEETAHRLIVGPGRCHLPGRRAWGWAAQLYATRSRDSWGIGDLADLGRLARWAADECRAGFLLVNPLHATAPVAPIQASPYFPASRRFRNPVYLRVEEVPGAGRAGADLQEAAARGRELNRRRHIDRDAVWRLKLAALEAIWRCAPPGPEFDQWRARQGDGLREFATWCTLAEQYGGNWRIWPQEYRHPAGPAVGRFAREHADRVRFHAWLQWLTERQLTENASGVTLIQDLPVGVDPGGADAWSWQDLLAQGVSVGAPADEFNTEGQDWGLPPFVPWKLRRAGYRPFADSIRATVAAAGGLRIDHVMGLFRLWWVPSGAGAGQGAYVRYPAADLLDIVALESHRAGALVIGEDLGTVEPGVRETLAEYGVLSYRLLWFEQDDPATWPEHAMAAVTTHDLPTVAGLWDGSDLEAQRRLGLEPNEESSGAVRRRLARGGGLDAGAGGEEAVLAAHQLMARAPSVLLSATLDDALAEPERPNIPGADDQRPNWCLALPVPLEELQSAPLPRKLAAVLAEPRARPRDGREPGGEAP
ncbi:4-alpha-glucanotransferase [Planobispora siamensis]|uniref:4-alpha-glucanotransferase n=1 Tax=Planobispora siamensis TaxID=936338 RepID=A0A8J3WPS8_9ACTN|nr:4-alpha-glucanotransferase [Planobispora siamensis]GIH96032.1 4-alpha-glucanotransferase [Planobispora siamensis]